MAWINSVGRVNVDEKAGRLVVDVNFDFVNYYNWFIMREFWIKPSTPRHKAHVSLVLPKFHKVNLKNARTWQGDKVNFQYDPEIQIGGSRKGFQNFWLKVRSPDMDAMKKALGVIDDKNYRGLHLTISSTKHTEGGVTTSKVMPWWPEMISITTT